MLLALAGALCLGPLQQSAAPAEGPPRVSAFGRYEGWSTERFDSRVTSSRYLEMRDGVRLALEVTRPAVDGVATEEAFPVLWTHSRYHRNPSQLAKVFSGRAAPGIRSMVDARPDLQRLVRHGYVVVAVSVRGSGASFGRFEGLFSANETKDAAEVTAWLVAQPWCDGNVGMYGGSYLGITQYMAASLDPPALKALFPDVAAFDMYELLYPGGVFRDDMIGHWDELTRRIDREVTAPPVDGDEGGALLAAAVAEHARNWEVLEGYRGAPLRDHAAEDFAWATHGPAPFLDEINAAAVPAYHFNGWFDVFVLDATLWFANYAGPQKLAIGPWSHGGLPFQKEMIERMRLTSIEQHRWYDRWLKGIPNGVDREPPVHYALMVEPGEWEWRSSATWPPAGVEGVAWMLDEGRSGSVESGNDGRLSPGEPGGAGLDRYAVDARTTTGSSTRWDNAVGAAMRMTYVGLAARDAAALTWTSAPLEDDLAVVGHPVVTLFAAASHGDADLFLVLEEVDEAGDVRYVTEGVLRASHRRLAEAPWDNLGLPYQRSFAADREPLPADEPAEVVFDLLPTANVFDAGHRIRLALTCADADNAEERLDGPEGAELRVHRGARHPSRILLPVLPRAAPAAAPK